MEKTIYVDNLGRKFYTAQCNVLEGNCGHPFQLWFIMMEGKEAKSLITSEKLVPHGCWEDMQLSLDKWAKELELGIYSPTNGVLAKPEPVSVPLQDLTPIRDKSEDDDDYDGTTPLKCREFEGFWQRWRKRLSKKK